MSQENDFSDWTEVEAEELLDDCVTCIEEHAAIPNKRLGIYPVTVTVNLKDFKRAASEIAGLGTPEHLCVTQAMNLVFSYGTNFLKAENFELYFDQNEKFYGHVHDRVTNKKSRRIDPIWERVIHHGEANSKKVIPLQVADLFAWAAKDAEQAKTLRYKWQEHLTDVFSEAEVFRYEYLKNPNAEVVSRVSSWRLPRRSALK
jgi:hypothetical protein